MRQLRRGAPKTPAVDLPALVSFAAWLGFSLLRLIAPRASGCAIAGVMSALLIDTPLYFYVFAVLTVAGGVLGHALPGWRGADLGVFRAMLAIAAQPDQRLIALLDDGGLLAPDALRGVRDRLKLSQRLYLRLKAAHAASEALAEGADIRRLIYAHGREAALDAVAQRYNATPGQVAVAWQMVQPGITAPIASATSVAQLHELVKATHLQLDSDALAQLDAASAQG